MSKRNNCLAMGVTLKRVSPISAPDRPLVFQDGVPERTAPPPAMLLSAASTAQYGASGASPWNSPSGPPGPTRSPPPSPGPGVAAVGPECPGAEGPPPPPVAP